MHLTLADFTGPTRTSGDQTVYQHCPACKDDRWHMYLGDNGGYYCFKCGERGFLEGASPPTLRDASKSYEWAPIDPPDTDPLDAHVLRYLAVRGVERKLAFLLGMRRLQGENRLYVPYRNGAGDTVFWAGRALADETPKYLYPGGIPCPIWICGLEDAPPVLVEGIFDAITVAQAGFLGLALGGKAMQRAQREQFARIVSPCETVHICLDGDALADAIKLSQDLGLRGYITSVVALNDGEDPSSLGPNELLRRLL